MLYNEIHNLYPEIIYSFNRTLFSIWGKYSLGKVPGLEGKEAYLVPVFFNTSSRTFHWLGLDSPVWKIDEPTAQWHLTELIDHLCRWNHDNHYRSSDEKEISLKLRAEVWSHFLADLQPTAVSEAASRLVSLEIENIKNIGKTAWKAVPRDWEKLHHAVLILYSGYHQNARGNIEGVFYTHFEQASKPIEQGYLTGTLGYIGGKTEGTFDYLTINDEKEVSLITESDPFLQALEILTKEVFLNNLLLRINDTRSDLDRTPFGEGLSERRRIVFVPVLDVSIYDPVTHSSTDYGRLKTLLIFFFKEGGPEAEQIYQKWIDERYAHLSDQLYEISHNITASGMTLAASQPIRPPYDLIHFFLQALRYVQDWESATVYQNGQAKYRYNRIAPKNRSFKWGWQLCDRSALPVVCPAVHESIKLVESSGRYGMWWTAGDPMECGGTSSNLWSADFITGIDAEEIARFGDLSIHFEFPNAVCLPDMDADGGKPLRILRQEYLRQQRDLLHALIPQVRARRAALRSAVSAIMGRNMSHNIGSHVIARQIGQVKNDLDVPRKDGLDHRESFLGYLQRRMDFLAEIATSDQSYWEQPLALGATLDVLNFQKQMELIGGKEKEGVPDGSKPILLSLITGKDRLDASVILASEEAHKLLFSCPGGEVGAHALYVILENIIRNSARHNSSQWESRGLDRDCLQLNIYVEDAVPANDCPEDANTEAKDLIAITVVDVRTEISGSKSDLVATQNAIFSLEEAGFLNEDNTPVTQFWGLREMQVCANYLRSMALTELESPALCSFQPIKATVWTDHLSKKDYLAYRFYLKRARILAYATAEDDDVPHLPAGCERIILRNDNSADTEPCVDWADIAEHARGYSFLWLPEALKEAPNIRYRHKLPQRVVYGSSAELNAMLQGVEEESSGDKASSLEWTDLLHRKVMDRYRTHGKTDEVFGKAKLWGHRPVELVFFPDRYEPKPQKDDGITLSLGQFDDDEIEDGMDDLEGHCSEDHPDISPVKLAVLDHVTEDKLWGWMDNVPNDPVLQRQADLRPWTHDDFHSGLRAACLSAGKDYQFANWAAVEPVWSASLQMRAFETEDGNMWRLRELAAALFARVIVLDERVQAARKQPVRGVTLWRYWPMAGIWSPFHPQDLNSDDPENCIDPRQIFHDPNVVCNLDQPKFDQIKSFLKAPTLLERQWPADFLVIHLTILESLNRERNLAKEFASESIANTLENLVRDTQVDEADVIIVTGRGVPAVARAHNGDILPARHLPISTLLEHLSIRPSKLGLMRALWAASSPI